jgi:hypothetical protein
MKNSNPLARNEGLVIQNLDGEVLIYDLTRDKAVCLNETAALVWRACDGTKSVAEITASIGKELNANVDQDIVWLALDQLGKEKLIEEQAIVENKFAGMSRREVVRKIGIGAVVAIPIVSSLMAPTVYAAGSACATAPSNCDCGNNGNSTTCGTQTCTGGCICYRLLAGASAGRCGVA